MFKKELDLKLSPLLFENDLIQFFYVTLAPIIEEFGFRLLLIGIPLFVMYSARSSLKYFVKCLWSPSNLNIYDAKKAFLLVIFVGVPIWICTYRI